MKKPVWVRLIGLMAVVVWALDGYGIWTFERSGRPHEEAVAIVALFVLAVAETLVWAATCAVVSVIGSSARVQAAATRDYMMDALEQMRVPSFELRSADRKWMNPDTGIECSSCKATRGMLYCPRHDAPLCLECMSQHDSAGCTYIPAGRYRAAKRAIANQHAPMLTSPLSGIREA